MHLNSNICNICLVFKSSWFDYKTEVLIVFTPFIYLSASSIKVECFCVCVCVRLCVLCCSPQLFNVWLIPMLIDICLLNTMKEMRKEMEAP